MPRIRQRKVRARLGDPPSERERELWALLRQNLRQRFEARPSPQEAIRLRLEAEALGAEAQTLRRERTGRP